MTDTNQRVADWWRTGIIEMKPGHIAFRGKPVESLIGKLSFTQMIWWMAAGEELSEGRARLLEAALVAAVDHGPQAPSIASARMAMTCGVGINNAIASGVNALGDIHGGAGQQALTLYQSIKALLDGGLVLDDAVASSVERWRQEQDRFVPGFGHRFHPVDPRAPRLLALVDEAVSNGDVVGSYAAIGRGIERYLEARKGKHLPMNIDGATAVIYGELGCSPMLARGLFCLSRSVGIMSHALEQHEQGGRIKGPVPPEFG